MKNAITATITLLLLAWLAVLVVCGAVIQFIRTGFTDRLFRHHLGLWLIATLIVGAAWQQFCKWLYRNGKSGRAQ
jgi:uncharacterized membrane protein required for colicin V production